MDGIEGDPPRFQGERIRRCQYTSAETVDDIRSLSINKAVADKVTMKIENFSILAQISNSWSDVDRVFHDLLIKSNPLIEVGFR